MTRRHDGDEGSDGILEIFWGWMAVSDDHLQLPVPDALHDDQERDAPYGKMAREGVVEGLRAVVID
jgi:hypothetical protein